MANQVVTTELVLASSTASAEFSSIPLPTVEPSPLCPLCPFLAERFEVYRQIAYWKAMHQRAWQREQKLQQRITGPEKGTGTFFIAPIFPSP